MGPTKIQIILEGQNQAAAQIRQANDQIAALGTTSQTTTQVLAQNTQGVANLQKSVLAGTAVMRGMNGALVLVGSQAFPQLTAAALVAQSGFQALQVTAQATGASLTKLTIVSGALAAATYALTRSYTDLWDAQNQLASTQAAAFQTSRLREHIRKLGEEGTLSAEQVRRLFRDLSGAISLEQLSQVRDELKSLLPISEVERLQFAIKFTGLEMQHAAANAELYGAALTREDTLHHLNEQVEQHRSLASELEKRRAKLMEINGLTEEQAKGNREILEVDLDIYQAHLAVAELQGRMRKDQKVAADIRAGVQVGGLQRTIDDPESSPEDVLDAQLKLEEQAHEQRLARLDELLISDEEYWLAREELTEDHLGRIQQFEEAHAEREREIRRGRVEVTGQMFGAMAQLAAQFGREGFIAYKALAITEAVVATYLGATKALKDGDSYTAAIRAGVIIAMGAANIAQIAAQQPPAYSTGGVVPGAYTGRDDRTIMVGPGETILTPRQVRMIGPALVYHAIASTGGRLPGSYVPEYARMPMRFDTGGFAAAAPPAAPQTVQIVLIDDRQDQREWQARQSMKNITRQLRREGLF